MDKKASLLQKWAYALIIVVLSYLILVEAKKILVPVVLGLLLSYLLFPMVSFFEEKLKMPRSLSILLALLIGVALLGGLTNLFILQVKVFIRDFPVFKEQAISNLQSWQLFIEKKFKFSTADQEVWLQEQVTVLLDKSGQILKQIVKGSLDTVEIILFIPIFSFFMLYYRDRGKNFVLKLAHERNSKLTSKLLEQISKVTIKYIVGVLTVVIILAICHSIALSIIGVKYAIPLALLAAIFSFIPYFGTLTSGLIPLTFSLVFSVNPYQPLFVLIYFIFITFIDHNFLTPTITGGNVSLNPLVTILGLIISAFVWGIPGMIIVVPTLAVIKIICDNVSGLEPYGYILGTEHHGVDISSLFKLFRKKKE
jgi:predicted PurR-regulated permease PerM